MKILGIEFFGPTVTIRGECFKQRGPLLTRYRLIRSKNFGLFLHHLHRSDVRTPHDHPWWFVSLILWGGYVEHSPKHSEGMRGYGPGSLLFRGAEWVHRLELVQPTWTLVLVGKRERKWGFHTLAGWVYWKDYGYKEEGC